MADGGSSGDWLSNIGSTIGGLFGGDGSKKPVPAPEPQAAPYDAGKVKDILGRMGATPQTMALADGMTDMTQALSAPKKMYYGGTDNATDARNMQIGDAISGVGNWINGEPTLKQFDAHRGALETYNYGHANDQRDAMYQTTKELMPSLTADVAWRRQMDLRDADNRRMFGGGPAASAQPAIAKVSGGNPMVQAAPPMAPNSTTGAAGISGAAGGPSGPAATSGAPPTQTPPAGNVAVPGGEPAAPAAARGQYFQNYDALKSPEARSLYESAMGAAMNQVDIAKRSEMMAKALPEAQAMDRNVYKDGPAYKQDQEMAGSGAKELDEINQKSTQAVDTLQKVALQRQMLGVMEQNGWKPGAFGDFRKKLSQTIQQTPDFVRNTFGKFGINTNDQLMSAVEGFDKLASEGTIGNLKDTGVQRMTQTEIMHLAPKMSAGLNTSIEGNRIMLNIREAESKAQMAMPQAASAYKARNGGVFDSGFYSSPEATRLKVDSGLTSAYDNAHKSADAAQAKSAGAAPQDGPAKSAAPTPDQGAAIQQRYASANENGKAAIEASLRARGQDPSAILSGKSAAPEGAPATGAPAEQPRAAPTPQIAPTSAQARQMLPLNNDGHLDGALFDNYQVFDADHQTPTLNRRSSYDPLGIMRSTISPERIPVGAKAADGQGRTRTWDGKTWH